ncbi:LytR/AlgR family response regulator transcription factor [Runella limosa]|uniref:LytR/AlgR family response regulator transcription factor n=1 Tax=Runella limosa TaxID=370978 RepID=UPI00041A0C83|nr:LytTR family transcriptional regulator DNA-binding domain-containing protein [Runella limosa]
MFTTLLIDDEPIALGRLKRLLTQFDDLIEVVDEALNGLEGIQKIETLRPNLLFLDIEMPQMTGFEMLSRLSYMPMVVFVTAYDQYAIKAFEENSIDYLLKPVEKERLAKTMDKLRNLRPEQEQTLSQESLRQLIGSMVPKKEMHSISVKSGDKILFVPLSDISFFQAEDKYVLLNTVDNKQYLMNYTITSLEEKLPSNFVRVSRSTIVNSTKIREMERYFTGKYMIVMLDQKQTKIESGSTYQENVKRLMEF